MQEHELKALHEELVELFAQVFAVTARAFAKLAEFDAKGCAAMMHYQSTAHYLNFAAGISLGTARDHVRVARALVELPALADAFGKGSISYSKVRALTRIATAENERQLLTVAQSATASQLERIVRGCRSVTLADAQKQLAARTAEYGFDEDGMFFMRVRLMPDEGARLMSALGGVLPTDERPINERRADAVMALGCSEAKTELIVHVEGESCQVETPMGEQVSVSAETSRRAACDASVVMMVHDKDGNVLDVGRKTRKISAGLKRALAARDKGCRYPGCPNTLVDAHHIKHWAEGGETSLSNLVQLCRYHHRLLHEGAYTIAADGTFLNTHGLPARPAVTPTAVSTQRWMGVDWTWRNADYGYIVNGIVTR